MKRNMCLVAILMAMVLSACVGPGAITRIPVTMPNGERATIVAHNQIGTDWMLDRNKLALNFIVKGDVSDKQLAAVATAENACRIYTGTVRPNNLVAVGSGAILYTGAGAAGIGLGATAFEGVKAGEYAIYGASASGFGGLANGIISLGGQTYTFENCGREMLGGIFPAYGVHVLQKSPY